MHKIKNLHRLYWTNKTESYMFDGCMRSVLESLRETGYDFDFFAALTGDYFSQMFDPTRAVDSLTHDYFTPKTAEHAFSACGYACSVLEEAALTAAPDAALARIQDSLAREVPVIARGIGPTEAFSLIGGLEDDGTLLVNIWDEQDAPDGYTRVSGLSGCGALIFAGEKAGEPAFSEVFNTVIESIPKHITRAPRGACRFAGPAYRAWADALLDDGNFAGTDEEIEDARAVLHDAPLIQLTTNAAGVRRVFGRINREHPELGAVRMLAPVYADVMSATAELLRAQDAFFVPPERLRERALREAIAAQLNRIAALMDDVYAVFCE